MILALETATTACSAAVCDGGGHVVAERVSLEGPAHSQLLLPFVRDVLEEAGCDWPDIDVVAVGLGPGAFTGLRIGIATARALAQADGRVVLAGVPTTSALAVALSEHHTAAQSVGAQLAAGDDPALVPLIDGKRREVFAAVYRREAAGPAGVLLREDVAVVRADDLAAWLDARGPAIVGGDGARLYADRLPSSASPAPGLVAPTASMVGRAVALGAPGVVTGPHIVLPVYGRSPDAAPRPAGGIG